MQQTQQQIERVRTLQEQLDSALHKTAQESTLLAESAAIKEAIANAKPEVDLSGVAQETTLLEVKNAVENIELPEIDTTELAKESTLNEVSSKLDNLNVEVDLTSVAKESTLETQGGKIDRILDIMDEKYANEINDILGV